MDFEKYLCKFCSQCISCVICLGRCRIWKRWHTIQKENVMPHMMYIVLFIWKIFILI